LLSTPLSCFKGGTGIFQLYCGIAAILIFDAIDGVRGHASHARKIMLRKLREKIVLLEAAQRRPTIYMSCSYVK